MSARVVRYRTDEGSRVAIAKVARTRVHVLLLDYRVRVRSFPVSEVEHMTDLDYPVKKAARGFARVGRGPLGITKSARRFRFIKEIRR